MSEQSYEKEFKILSIDGGGIKGLYSAVVLAEIEKKNGSIAEHFDLICGTSTGGIIALALAAGKPASEIVDFYKKFGPRIFCNPFFLVKWFRSAKQVMWGGKYGDCCLKHSLTSVLGKKKIKESNSYLCIPSYDLTIGRINVLKTDHDLELSRDSELSMVDVALATAAAPTYFPIAKIDGIPGGQFVDGGIWANNPSLVGINEALRFFVGEGKRYKSFRLLSIASITNNTSWPAGVRRKRSFAGWRGKLINIIFDAQSEHTRAVLQFLIPHISPKGAVTIIDGPKLSEDQAKVIDLDKTSKNALITLERLGHDKGHYWNTHDDIKAFFKTVAAKPIFYTSDNQGGK
ncbi:MAG: patatin-like phospholipase family protein [Nitrospirae bacterium]|nr:patatin-like phospholipase family protein [Nitrospirota bacterium]